MSAFLSDIRPYDVLFFFKLRGETLVLIITVSSCIGAKICIRWSTHVSCVCENVLHGPLDSRSTLTHVTLVVATFFVLVVFVATYDRIAFITVAKVIISPILSRFILIMRLNSLVITELVVEITRLVPIIVI